MSSTHGPALLPGPSWPTFHSRGGCRRGASAEAGADARQRSRAGRLLALGLVAGLWSGAALGQVIVFNGDWMNNTFGSTGDAQGRLSFDGKGNASFTLITDTLFGQAGNFTIPFKGPIDPTDYSWSAVLANHPQLGRVEVSLDPEGNLEGMAPSVPLLGGRPLAFTGVVDLATPNASIDLDINFSFPTGGNINTVFDLVSNAKCVPSSTVSCLNKNRFKVEVDWRSGAGASNRGPGIVVPQGSDDSGLFFFFDSNNWEMLIKVVNACAINDRYWVFFAATTNVELTVTVTDTKTNAQQTYFNPLGRAAPPVQDTSAFATCP